MRNGLSCKVTPESPTRPLSDKFCLPFPSPLLLHLSPLPPRCIISLSRSTMSAYTFLNRTILAGNSLHLPPPPLRSHSWAHVIIGMWHKYPNPHCSHVVTVDVIDRTVNPSTGIIRTERVLGCKQRTPTWIVRVRFLASHCRYHPQRAHLSHSYSVVRRMRSFVKFLLWIPRRKQQRYPLSTSHSPNSRRATKRYFIRPHLMGEPHSNKRPRFRRGW